MAFQIDLVKSQLQSTINSWLILCLTLTTFTSGQWLSETDYIAGKVNYTRCSPPPPDHSIYDYSIKDIYQENDISLADHQSKAILLVNVATY